MTPTDAFQVPVSSRALLMGFYFYPRGGSAQVARDLCRALVRTSWRPALASGSVGGVDDVRNAHRFFDGIPCTAMDYTEALEEWERGRDPMEASVPLHASYEDKDGVPDCSFLALDDDAFERQVQSWSALLADTALDPPEVVHLHHLTPVHQAVRAVWGDVPVVSHLHGTELKMLAGIDDESLVAASDAEHPFAGEWQDRLRTWAGDSDRLVVVSPQDRVLAGDLLPVEPDRIVTIGNCVDTDLFSCQSPDAVQRLARWHHWLVEDPRGWSPDGGEGSLRCEPEEFAAFTDESGALVPVVTFVGRFMHFKRVQLLIEAHHTMRTTTGLRSVLVIAGGFPGEWEGEHPADTVARLGAQDVFFVGWRDHDEVSEILRCSDVFAALSVDEPFGLVFLEAMAAGVPPITTATGGPATFINTDPDNPTGWLVPPDDLEATVAALIEAVGDPDERQVRGRRAAEDTRANHSWETAATQFTDIYEAVVAEHTT
jgi:glycosyltransferase involved in cell wall biosynthesis